MLRRLMTWSYDRRRRVVALWVAALVAVSVLAGAAGGDNEVDFTVPGSDSAEAVELLQERFPRFAGGTVDVVYTAAGGVTGPDTAARIEALAGDLARVDHVVAAEPGPVSPDGSIGMVQVRFDVAAERVPAESVERVMDLAGEAEGDGLRIELGGYPIEKVERSEAGSESVGLVAALLILLVAFGSALAAGLPLVVAGLGLGVALGGIWLTANVVDVPDFGVQIATMIGIGVGIDYALFIVTRYRSALALGHPPRQAVAIAGSTAGRAVVFAGSTVVISIFGLVLMGRDYLWGVAVATSLAVSVVVFASVTVLPALLGFAGRSIDRLRLPRFRRHVDGRRTLSWRWSRVMQRRPLAAGLGALTVLLVLAAPATGLRFGMPDAGNGSSDLTSRRAYDLTREGFGPGANGPLLVAVDLRAGAAGTDAGAARAVDRIADDLQATDGVAAVLPAALNDAGDAAVLTVVPRTGPQDEATESLVHTLRDEVLPGAVAGTGAEASVGGNTAAFIDDSEDTASRLPLLIGGVVILSFLLLMTVFRSLAVALKAAVMNLLSIGAAYGVMALAAGGGRLGDLVGIEDATPVPGVAADDHVRRALRVVDGLRGVPPVPRARGVRADPGQPPGRGRRAGEHRPGDHRGGGDHGDGVRRLRDGGRRVPQAGRHRPGDRRVRRRHRGAPGAGALDDGAARGPQLVAAPVARPAAAPRRRRGRAGDPRPRAGRHRGPPGRRRPGVRARALGVPHHRARPPMNTFPLQPDTRRCHAVADIVILSGQDIGQAQRATSAIFGVVLAEFGTTFDEWVVLNALATGAFPPERAGLVPGLAGALATGPAAVEALLDQAEAAGLARIVSAPGGDPGAVRVELTAAGRVQHRTLRSALDLVADELYSGIPEADLAAAHRVLVEVTWRADGWLNLWEDTRPAEPVR